MIIVLHLKKWKKNEALNVSTRGFNFSTSVRVIKIEMCGLKGSEMFLSGAPAPSARVQRVL